MSTNTYLKVNFSTMMINPLQTLLIPITFFFLFVILRNVIPLIVSLVYVIIVLFVTRMPTFDPPGDRYVMSPAEGFLDSILVVDVPNTTIQQLQFVILLNVFNIHSQHAAVSGPIRHIEYKAGEFSMIFGDEKGENNERCTTVVTSPVFGDVETVQIAGTVFRTINNIVVRCDSVVQGQLMGSIFMGSRVDLFIHIDRSTMKIIAKEKTKLKIGDILVSS